MSSLIQLTWRQRRADQGLTQVQVARAAGTSPSNVSAYEVGTKTPNDATIGRIEAAIEAGSASPVHRHGLMTVPRCAASIRRALRAGGRANGELIGLVAEMLAHAEKVTADRDTAIFFARPSTTGDRRWDALLAGSVERFALRHGMEPPAWTNTGYLDTCWFVGSNPGLHALAFARSPASLHARGVMIDPADLESV